MRIQISVDGKINDGFTYKMEIRAWIFVLSGFIALPIVVFTMSYRIAYRS